MTELHAPDLRGYSLDEQLQTITNLIEVVKELMNRKGPKRLDNYDFNRAYNFKRKLFRIQAGIKLEIARRDQTSLFC